MTGPHQTCSTCSSLRDYEFAMQKHGREDEDSFFPDAISGLKFVRTIPPGKTRSPELLVCPECKTYYLSSSEYEYLATGSEDSQTLERLTPELARKHLEA